MEGSRRNRIKLKEKQKELNFASMAIRFVFVILSTESSFPISTFSSKLPIKLANLTASNADGAFNFIKPAFEICRSAENGQRRMNDVERWFKRMMELAGQIDFASIVLELVNKWR